MQYSGVLHLWVCTELWCQESLLHTVISAFLPRPSSQTELMPSGSGPCACGVTRGEPGASLFNKEKEYIYIYMYICTCINIYINIFIHIYIHVYLYLYHMKYLEGSWENKQHTVKEMKDRPERRWNRMFTTHRFFFSFFLKTFCLWIFVYCRRIH